MSSHRYFLRSTARRKQESDLREQKNEDLVENDTSTINISDYKILSKLTHDRIFSLKEISNI